MGRPVVTPVGKTDSDRFDRTFLGYCSGTRADQKNTKYVYVNFKHIVDLVGFWLEPDGRERFNIKGVHIVRIGSVLEMKDPFFLLFHTRDLVDVLFEPR